jgi:hypothetical protein
VVGGGRRAEESSIDLKICIPLDGLYNDMDKMNIKSHPRPVAPRVRWSHLGAFESSKRTVAVLKKIFASSLLHAFQDP